MKTTLMAVAMLLTFGVAVFANGTEEVKENKKNTVTYTVKQIIEMYGANNVIMPEDFEEDMEIEFMLDAEAQAQPCPGTGLIPCEAAIAMERARLRPIANECCCTFRSGAECCANGVPVAVLFLVEPSNPNCTPSGN